MPHAVATAAPRVLTDNAADAVRGIALAVLAYLIWTVGDASAKWVLPSVGVAGAMMWRGVFGLATVAAVTVRPGTLGWRMLVPHRWGLVLVRSVLSSFVSVCWYISWLSMSLADTYAVGFTAPLIMTVLAVPLLGERIRWRRALSTLVGFGGVLIMLRPGGDLWTPVVLLLLAGTLVMALTRIMTRQLTLTETPECQAFWLLVCHTATGFLLLWSFPGQGAIHSGGVAAAGLPGPFERSGALRVRPQLRAGTGVGTGALRIHDAAMGRAGGVADLWRGAVLEYAGRCCRGGGIRHL